MKLKSKLALGLGSMAAIVAPIATVVACGDSNKDGSGSSDGANTPIKIVGGQQVAPAGYKIPDGTTRIIGNEYVRTILPAGFTIPEGVTSIEAGAFRGATLPAGFSLPTSYTVKGYQVFDEYSRPQAGYMWSKSSFGDPELNAKIVPIPILAPGTTSIDKNMFNGATLPAGFTIPTSVTSIEDRAFDSCWLQDGYTWSSVDSNGHPTVGSKVVPFTVGSTIVAAQSLIGMTLPTDYTVPTNIIYVDALHGSSAFEWATLPTGFKWSSDRSKVVPIPTLNSSDTIITDGAFLGANLPAGFNIPSNVTSIGESAFEGATLPAGFTIPQGVTSIGGSAFRNAKLPANFTIPSGIKYEHNSFKGSYLQPGLTTQIDNFDELSDGYYTTPMGYKWSKTITVEQGQPWESEAAANGATLIRK